MKSFKYAVVAALAGAQPLLACDLCSIYAASEARGEIGKGVVAGVAEQFTHFGTLQEDGNEVPNVDHQYLDSSISQLLIGYNFTEQFGVQFNAPIIYRQFRRPEGAIIDRGTVSGLGDVALIGHLQAYRYDRHDTTIAWNLLAGVKFPTGDSSRLGEEAEEEEPPPGAQESGIHGHDLALGSGSFDGIIGTSVYTQWRRAFFSAAVQYAIRTEGDFSYQYANDLTWSGGPGVMLMMTEPLTLSLQANVTGEYKGFDRFEGARAEDTKITSVFLGPEIMLTWRGQLSVEIGADIPVSINNSALQAVPDYRLRGAVTWHF